MTACVNIFFKITNIFVLAPAVWLEPLPGHDGLLVEEALGVEADAVVHHRLLELPGNLPL